MRFLCIILLIVRGRALGSDQYFICDSKMEQMIEMECGIVNVTAAKDEQRIASNIVSPNAPSNFPRAGKQVSVLLLTPF